MKDCYIKDNFSIYGIVASFFGCVFAPLKLESFIFSGGEVHVKIEKCKLQKIRINCRINSSDDLMRLVLIVDALRAMHSSYIEVFMPYIPYARQDRRMVDGEPLSIKAFANILNSLKLDKVICYDAHSEVSLALIDNVEHHDNYDEVSKFIFGHLPKFYPYTNGIVCSPDAGAYKKIFKMCQHIQYDGEIIVANKLRNLATGKIIATELRQDVKDKDCLIVDDIIDGGGTFIALAKVLKEKGARDLYLFGSHGIFSKGYEELLSHFKIIGTTNSFKEEYPEIIKVIKLEI